MLLQSVLTFQNPSTSAEESAAALGTGTTNSEATRAQGDDNTEDAENTEHDISVAGESLEPTSDAHPNEVSLYYEYYHYGFYYLYWFIIIKGFIIMSFVIDIQNGNFSNKCRAILFFRVDEMAN